MLCTCNVPVRFRIFLPCQVIRAQSHVLPEAHRHSTTCCYPPPLYLPPTYLTTCPLAAIPRSLQRRYSVLLATSFGAWRAHLLQEVADKMKQLSSLLHWERHVLSSAMLGWHAHVLKRAHKAEVSLAAQRHYVACLYTRALQVGLL